MLYLQTFESYLEGARAPLYHFAKDLYNLLKDDILNLGQPSYPKNRKAICLTRYKGYTEAFGADRLQLDTNKLIKAGFRPIPIAETGTAISHRLKRGGLTGSNKEDIKIKTFLNYSKPFQQGITFTPGVEYPESKIGMGIPSEYEFEERIYKPIPNIGKYIMFIDLRNEPNDKELKILKDYITKYPQIVVRKLKYKQIKTGKIVREVPLETPTEIILDINMIK